METKAYKIRYLPLFQNDLLAAANYIDEVLQNPNAANRLIDAVEQAIEERSYCPLAFEPYPSSKKRKHPYYRIYIKSYTVYYVVIGDVMEIRRFLYSAREANLYL